jgi:hypothetical protein
VMGDGCWRRIAGLKERLLRELFERLFSIRLSYAIIQTDDKEGTHWI